MAADVELLPLPEPVVWITDESVDAIKSVHGKDSPYGIHGLTCKYAKCVNPLYSAETVDALQAEIEALRAEVERLRAIAGCAYQMAGVHDAPEVWLDRLGQAANGDALPDPDTISDELLPYQPDAVCEAEARAERLAEALRERRDWFEAQAKSISKGNGSSWDLMQVREQRDLCDAALAQENDDA